LRCGAPKRRGVVAEIRLSRKGSRHLNDDEVVASLGDERAVWILGTVIAVGGIDRGERQENRRRRNECEQTAIHLALDSHAVKPPSPLNPRSAMTNFANR
jgi:hypothetical protein